MTAEVVAAAGARLLSVTVSVAGPEITGASFVPVMVISAVAPVTAMPSLTP